MKKIITVIVSVTSLFVLIFSAYETIQRAGNNVQIVRGYLHSPGELLSEDFRCNAVKPVVYEELPPLDTLSIDERKDAFVRIVLPSVLIAEHDIKLMRNKLLRINEKISHGNVLNHEEISFMGNLSEKYRTDDVEELLSRLNVHPASIILAQAALESGWGTSRMFSEAKNIFGIWTFKNNSGIKAISSGARLSVYDSTLESVSDYLYNINVSWAYKEFREMRTLTPRSLNLTAYLNNYSILRGEYITRLNTLIRSNNFEAYDSCRIDPDFIY
jgi:Bax protein